MDAFTKLLDSLSADSTERGKQFEIACKGFLENDRGYSALIEKVWLSQRQWFLGHYRLVA